MAPLWNNFSMGSQRLWYRIQNQPRTDMDPATVAQDKTALDGAPMILSTTEFLWKYYELRQ